MGPGSALADARLSGTTADKIASARRGQLLRTGLPGPLSRGEADQPALNVVATPVAQQLGSCFILHPFCDGLDSESARKIDQRLHESAIIRRRDDVLYKGAVD